MANAKLVDLSHWNGPSDPTQPMVMEWGKARDQGVVGANLRLGSINDTTGNCYLDSRVLEITASAVNAGMPLGYYFYARPKHDGKKQAEYILEMLAKYQLPIDLDVWYDVEVVGLSPTQARDSTKAAMTVLRDELGPSAGIYCRQSFWDPNVAADPMWSTLPLWAARWSTVLTSPWSDDRFKFRDWDNWRYWQWSADGNGKAAEYGFPSGDKDIDLNWYNGTDAQFIKAYDLNPVEELRKQVEQLERWLAGLQTEHDALKVRATALEGGVTYLDKQLKTANTVIDLTATKAAENRTWLQKLDAWAKGISLK